MLAVRTVGRPHRSWKICGGASGGFSSVASLRSLGASQGASGGRVRHEWQTLRVRTLAACLRPSLPVSLGAVSARLRGPLEAPSAFT